MQLGLGWNKAKGVVRVRGNKVEGVVRVRE